MAFLFPFLSALLFLILLYYATSKNALFIDSKLGYLYGNLFVYLMPIAAVFCIEKKESLILNLAFQKIFNIIKIKTCVEEVLM